MNLLKRELLFLAATLLSGAMMCGCGGTKAVPPVTTPAPAAIDGLWEFSSFNPPASSTTPLNRQVIFSGALHNNGGVVTGAGQVTYTPGSGTPLTQCFGPTAVTVSGTLDDSRHLTFTSNSVYDTVFTFSADVPNDLTASLTGTASATGTCSVPSESASGTFVDLLNGKFVGNIQSGLAGTTNATVGTATMTLSETAPDAIGMTQITGTATLAFSGCSIDLPVSQTRIGPTVQTQIYPATPPVVSASGGHDGLAFLNVWYVGSDCKIQPAVLPLTESHWIGNLLKQ